MHVQQPTREADSQLSLHVVGDHDDSLGCHVRAALHHPRYGEPAFSIGVVIGFGFGVEVGVGVGGLGGWGLEG